jgi:hypothetical protein
MRPFFRYILIALLIVAAFWAGYKFGYVNRDYERSLMENKVLDDTYRRIREEEARNKLGAP